MTVSEGVVDFKRFRGLSSRNDSNYFFTDLSFSRTVPNNTCTHLDQLQKKNWSFAPRNWQLLEVIEYCWYTYFGATIIHAKPYNMTFLLFGVISINNFLLIGQFSFIWSNLYNWWVTFSRFGIKNMKSSTDSLSSENVSSRWERHTTLRNERFRITLAHQDKWAGGKIEYKYCIFSQAGKTLSKLEKPLSRDTFAIHGMEWMTTLLLTDHIRVGVVFLTPAPKDK